MILKHTGFTNSTRASIVRDGGTPQEIEVGYATRRMAATGRVYTVHASDHSRVYTGRLMSEGVQALVAYLKEQQK